MTDRIDTTAAREWLAMLDGHTPAPWQVLSEDQGISWGTHWSVCAAKNVIDEISESVGRGEDASLIAAAPDLKATLAAALDEIDRLRAALDEMGAQHHERGLDCALMDDTASDRAGIGRISVFGVNPSDPEKEPVVIICLNTESGAVAHDMYLLAPSDYARGIALKLLDEADAIDRGARPVARATPKASSK